MITASSLEYLSKGCPLICDLELAYFQFTTDGLTKLALYGTAPLRSVQAIFGFFATHATRTPHQNTKTHTNINYSRSMRITVIILLRTVSIYTILNIEYYCKYLNLTTSDK